MIANNSKCARRDASSRNCETRWDLSPAAGSARDSPPGVIQNTSVGASGVRIPCCFLIRLNIQKKTQKKNQSCPIIIVFIISQALCYLLQSGACESPNKNDVISFFLFFFYDNNFKKYNSVSGFQLVESYKL